MGCQELNPRQSCVKQDPPGVLSLWLPCRSFWFSFRLWIQSKLKFFSLLGFIQAVFRNYSWTGCWGTKDQIWVSHMQSMHSVHCLLPTSMPTVLILTGFLFHFFLWFLESHLLVLRGDSQPSAQGLLVCAQGSMTLGMELELLNTKHSLQPLELSLQPSISSSVRDIFPNYFSC